MKIWNKCDSIKTETKREFTNSWGTRGKQGIHKKGDFLDEKSKKNIGIYWVIDADVTHRLFCNKSGNL